MQGPEGYCYCTLALGQEYCYLAKQLASDLEQYAPGSTLFILTDHPKIFEGVANVKVIFHRKRSVVGYNDKLCVVKRALNSYNTCIFLDADIRILDPIQLDQTVFAPGLTAYRIYSWLYFKIHESDWDRRVNTIVMPYLRKQMNLSYDDGDIPVVSEHLFAVTRCPQMDAFLEKWNALAELCEKKGIVRFEGFSIGLAGLLIGFPICQNEFSGLHMFEPVIYSRGLVQKGLMSEGDYGALDASISRYKHPVSDYSSMSGLWMTFQNRLRLNRFGKVYKFIKIQLLGLDLLR